MFRLRTYRSSFSNITARLSLRIFLAIAFCSLALGLSIRFAPTSFSAVREAFASPSSMMEITPGSGNTLTDSSGPLTFTGGPYLVANPSSQVDGNPTCNEALPCDEYAFTVSVSSTISRTKYVRIQIDWPVVGEAQFDLYVFDGTTTSGKLIAKSLGNQTYVAPDVALIPAIPASNGVYTLRIVPFLPFGQSISGKISLVDIPTAAPLDPGIAPAFSNHVSPSNLGNNAGEPSIGIDWLPRVATLRDDANKINTGGVAFFQSGANTLRVNFDDRANPAAATWEDKSAPTVQQFVLSDPIGFVDRQTGRVFSLDLVGGEGNSLAAFSDDDGNSWTPMQGGGSPAGPDHETLGGGPFNNAAVPAPPPHPLYPNAIYYCSQNIAGGAECSRSDDGGLTFGPGVDIFTPTQCYGGIHGHVKVGPDGTVYVPNSSCTSGNGGSQGMAVSRDNGLTWHDSTVPTSTGSGDPSVGIDADNNVFIGYVNADGRPHIAVSTNHGDTWSRDYDVGVPVDCNAAADPNPAYAPCRIKSAVFPVVVAGDKGRAAFGFLGSTTGGNYQDEATYQGIWYFYVATTFDGGNTWSTVNATPGDPVQKGSICLGGLTCGNDRNLLDFNDMSIDREGRVVAAYADGCVASAGCVAPSYTGRLKKAAIVRQSNGRRMFAAFDPSGTPTPTPTATPTPTPSGGVFYLHGTPADEVNKKQELTDPSYRGTATFDQNGPTGSTPITQTSQPVANDDFVGNSLAAYWRSPFTGTVNSNLELNLYWATPNADSTLQGVDMEISVFADPDYVADRVQPQHLIGRTTVTLGSVTPVPTLIQSLVPVNGTVNGELLIQITPGFVNTGSGLLILYDSTTTASNFKLNTSNATPTPTPTATATPTPSVTPTPVAGGPTYINYYPPSGVAEDFGEPSIGANWKSGKIMFFGGFSPYALRVGFDDATNPATVTWDQTNLLVAATPRVAGDPILFTDRETGRTFVSQLFGLTPFNGMDFTDDDGANYLPSQGSGIGSGIDHQTIGGGPFHAPIPAGATYPHSVYYCAQEGLNSNDTGIANCALSIDGGLTFGPAVPVYALALNECFPLHGHMKVGPDGTTYLPNRKCGNGAGLVLTEDNGITWSARTVPNSSVGDSDASLGIATDGSLFLGYEGADGHAYIAVSRDKGTTWTNPTDVGAQLGLQNAIFPAVVAGDGGANARAAFAFYGSTSPGDQDDPAFRGEWYLFISSTFDGGQTWTTVNATPGDPMQRDGICTRGFQGCTVPRNLLDFFDATIDREGRVVVGYQDGCMGACVQGGPNSNTKKGVIARQSGGRRMLAVFDSGNPTPTPTPTPSPSPTPTPGSDGPQTFQGTYDPNPYPCATARHHFNVPSGKARIVVQVNAALISNDLSVSLLYGSDPNPVLVQKTEDTGTCCEVLLYQPAGGVPAGEYQVQVCQTPTPNGVPQQPPYDYVGTFTADGTLAPTATPTPTPIPTPVPVYQKGGIAFSPSVTVRASVAARDGEPSLRVDKFGNTYVAGIRGVPAGVDLWYFDLNPNSPTYDPYMRNPIYRGQPDQFSPDESIEVGADGGGDVDLAVGFDEASPGNPPYLAFSSLTAANISTASSTDKGQTFIKNPAGNVTGGIPADDRQWMEFLGKDSVYLIYRTLEPAVALVQRSNDGGLTYGPAREVGTIGQVGGVSVDQSDGTVYIAGGNGVVAVGTPASPGAEPLTYTIHNVAGGGNAHLFFTVKAAKDGTVYVCYSNGTQVFIRWSRDKGNTWSPAIRVSDGPETATSIVPWMETGPTPGSIGVVWYGTTASSNNDNANWRVFFAQSLNATDPNPVFRQVELSDHFIHGSNISEQGLPITPGGAPNRNLLDYFQIGFDPTGAAVVAYTDDHNDIDGNVYVARQISGPGISGADVPAPVNGSALPQATPRPAGAPQVIDYAQDAKTGLLTVLPLNDPLDILSIKYSTEGTASNPVLVATMKVSDLTVVPPLSNWRMSFTANAPDSRMSPTGDYSFGLSDRGDQFFVRATTDALGAPTYTFGTAVRQHQYRGFIAYTDVGPADSGSFDTTAGTITIKVALGKLNATLAAGHTPIGPGSILAGLRGNAFTTGDDNVADRNDRAKSDVTRGGTQYAINSAPTAALTANPTSGAPPLAVNFDGSGSADPDAGDSLSYTFDFGDGSAPVTQSTATIAHTYNQLGKFNASLTVKDQSGFTSNTATVEINVTNQTPAASLSATPTSGYAPLVVNFDGSGSSDPDAGDAVASYTFDFGDGSVVTQSGAKIAHTYSGAGIYTAKLTVADNHGAVSTNSAQVQITANARPTTDCMEDDDARITYSDAWHNGTSTAASAGHFRWHTGKSPSHTAAVDFSIPANGTGVFSYRYGKSTKGGTAEVFIDGVSRGTINFKGTAGSDKSPEFASGGVAYEARYEGLSAGTHRFELRNMADSVFVDGFCLTVTLQPQPVTGGSGGTTTQTVFTGAPTTGPGQSTSNDSSVSAGQESKSSVTLGTDARAISIVAETSGDLPVKLALVSPTGLTLQIVDAVNGVAVLTTPVTQGGIYTVKVINVNLGPVQVWTVATPTIAR